MSESDQPNVLQRTSAKIRRSSWPGWIWAVPIAALGIVAWLAVRALMQSGVNITIKFDQAAGMQAGDTDLQYLGIKVGKVTDISLDEDGRHVDAKVNVDDDVKKYLRSNTRFWLQGADPSFSDLSSLKSIVAGPTIIMEPGDGVSARKFYGLDRKPAITGPQTDLVRYTMSFDGPVGQVKVGAPVTLRGFTVGTIEEIGFSYDAATGAIATPVTIALDPARFHITGGLQNTDNSGESRMNAVLERLIGEGMRARLTQDPPLIGSYTVTLDFVTAASPATLNTSGSLPQIPAQSSGSAQSIIDQVNQIPLDKISGRVLDIADHADQIISSPAIHDSIVHLDHTLQSVDKTARQAGPQITQLVKSLRQTAGEIDVASQAANRLMGGTPAGQDSNVRNAVHELTEAARSVRSLADYLDRHPEAVLKGKKEG